MASPGPADRFGYIGKVHAYGYRTMPLFTIPSPVPTRLVGVATSRPETPGERGAGRFRLCARTGG